MSPPPSSPCRPLRPAATRSGRRSSSRRATRGCCAATAPGATLLTPVRAVVVAVDDMLGGVAHALLEDMGVAVTHSSALHPGVQMPEATLNPEQLGLRHGGGVGGCGGPNEITTRVPGASGSVSQTAWALPPSVVGLAVVRRRSARARGGPYVCAVAPPRTVGLCALSVLQVVLLCSLPGLTWVTSIFCICVCVCVLRDCACRYGTRWWCRAMAAARNFVRSGEPISFAVAACAHVVRGGLRVSCWNRTFFAGV